jgi:protein disulfide-isomerase A1
LQFDDGPATLTSTLTEDGITKFVKAESLPLIVDFNHETAQKVFGGEIRSHVLMFLSKEAGQYDKYLDTHKKLAKELKDKVLFVSINTDDEDHGRILEFFGMKKEEVPAARLIKLADEMAKYKPEKDVLSSEENMREFVTLFLDGKLKVTYFSRTLGR